MEEDFRRAGLAIKPVRRLETSAEFEIGKGDDAVRVQLALDSPFRFAPPVDTPIIPVNDYRDLVVDPVELKARFHRLALEIMGRIRPQGGERREPASH